MWQLLQKLRQFSYLSKSILDDISHAVQIVLFGQEMRDLFQTYLKVSVFVVVLSRGKRPKWLFLYYIVWYLFRCVNNWGSFSKKLIEENTFILSDHFLPTCDIWFSWAHMKCLFSEQRKRKDGEEVRVAGCKQTGWRKQQHSKQREGRSLNEKMRSDCTKTRLESGRLWRRSGIGTGRKAYKALERLRGNKNGEWWTRAARKKVGKERRCGNKRG